MQTADDLSATVRHAATRLRLVSDADASRRPALEKWCAKEIIGHLIDSASNNHQRFVRARSQDDLAFSGYAQNEWVEAHDYVTAPWVDLVDLWELYNHLLARVMRVVPEATRLAAHTRHNLDRLAFRTPTAGAPVTLEFFMADYVEHLKHHLLQVDALGLFDESVLDGDL